MKNILGGLLLSTILVTPVLANAGPKTMAPCPTCPMPGWVKWGGFKVGMQAGYSMGKSHTNANCFITATGVQNLQTNNHIGLKGPLGGFHLAYDLQFAKNFILGLDGSMDFQSITGTDANLSTINNTENRWKANVRSKYTAALVARLGFCLQDSMYYLGAGLANSSWSIRGTVFPQGGGSVKLKAAKTHPTGLRVVAGAMQRSNRILYGVEATYDVYGHSTRRQIVLNETYYLKAQPSVLAFKAKLTYMM